MSRQKAMLHQERLRAGYHLDCAHFNVFASMPLRVVSSPSFLQESPCPWFALSSSTPTRRTFSAVERVLVAAGMPHSPVVYLQELNEDVHVLGEKMHFEHASLTSSARVFKFGQGDAWQAEDGVERTVGPRTLAQVGRFASNLIARRAIVDLPACALKVENESATIRMKIRLVTLTTLPFVRGGFGRRVFTEGVALRGVIGTEATVGVVGVEAELVAAEGAEVVVAAGGAEVVVAAPRDVATAEVVVAAGGAELVAAEGAEVVVAAGGAEVVVAAPRDVATAEVVVAAGGAELVAAEGAEVVVAAPRDVATAEVVVAAGGAELVAALRDVAAVEVRAAFAGGAPCCSPQRPSLSLRRLGIILSISGFVERNLPAASWT
ncbi:hypothetical protein PHYSODRAFT_302841 [Phytophthora sojae]|uniref:Uncharacterized protein n=1 Tax=Phytophthora sojae (strain P6497) TaxID=1094619 RepID=G4ZT54_PHYSP|nr:hypothetical protein PHYSODRAFT_302841 [Phytophthora sojae]EGZ13086.1 hypothetical protein PHYSODRAFT_302841 [Phytophthora sojae]|eukprot:XP_009530515.1 hypothetical protein PHYSODRAFT_302841 [Phytophthora sojae]